jgi:hypothetical protein
MEDALIFNLRPVERRLRRQALGWRLAACWSAAALAGLGFVLVQWETGWASPFTPPALAALAAAASLTIVLLQNSRPPDYRAVARRIEHRHPELNGLLLTAVQQRPPEGGSPSYLQHRLIELAAAHGREGDWRDVVPAAKLRLAQAAAVAALALLAAALAGLRIVGGRGGVDGAPRWGVVVTPGDTSLERGESLVVLARFGGSIPAGVTMIVRSSGEVPRSVALVKSLADPVFGASIPEVDRDLAYRLEYAGGSTREFKVSVFERPRLERADAVLNFPAYTRLAAKRIENTRRVSAVEGTRLDLALQLNKPVASAALVARDAKKTVIPLQLAEGKAVATLPDFPLVASQTYDLRLVDREGRANPLSTPFFVDVLPDRPPELHVSAPRGDIRPSPVEEVEFSGTVLGDFGLSSYGLAYTLDGGATKTVELGRSASAGEKRDFESTLSLEDLAVQPDQLISWYVWADDVGPDGKTRRTSGDLYFAEVRPFDEIFRENKGMQSPDDPSGGAQGGQSQRLIELQKQIIIATWKLQRDPSEPKYADDAKVVHDSQDQALAQAGAGLENVADPRARALWNAVAQAMKNAAGHLQEAARGPTALGPALASEQAAYQTLLRLQSRETEVSRGRGGRGGGASQRQLDQLDLSQEQNRYETQREAEAAQSPERREQLQVMSRLQELARRQQDVNDRLKEMQTALQEARTDAERDDIRRQLKRLQDEQQQVVADVDELRQRMDAQENRSAMSDQRRQLDQTRDDVQRAADAEGQGSVAEALASGTRAQRQLQDIRDELHKQNSSRFSDDLRDMREEARQLADREEAVAKQLDPDAAGGQPKRLSDTAEGGGAVPEIEEQKKKMADLVNRAKQVSQQAENTEPLLAEKLYDSLRKLSQDDTGTAKEFQQKLLENGLLTRNLNDHLTDTSGTEGTKSLDLTSALLQEGYLPQAREAEERARAGIDELKSGVEKAAESVIGDDTEALRLARSELDAVTDQLKREAAQAPGKGDTGPNPASPGAQEAGDRQGPARPAQNPESSGGLPRLAGGDNRAAPGGGGDPLGLDNLVNTGNGRGSPAQGAPITGNGYGQWSDRLRDVEEIVDSPDLRNAVAAARERARLLRQDYTRNLKRPDWAVVQLEVVKPLIEVRDQISDELARRESKDSLAPIDRDPVPNRFAESVRKYYEELGKDK